MIRLAAITLLVTVAIAVPSGLIVVSPVGAQIVDTDEPAEEAPGLGNIVGSPDAGPKPTDAGDRGGWAQLGLALVLLSGVGVIVARIVAGVRANDMT